MLRPRLRLAGLTSPTRQRGEWLRNPRWRVLVLRYRQFERRLQLRAARAALVIPHCRLSLRESNLSRERKATLGPRDVRERNTKTGASGWYRASTDAGIRWRALRVRSLPHFGAHGTPFADQPSRARHRSGSGSQGGYFPWGFSLTR